MEQINKVWEFRISEKANKIKLFAEQHPEYLDVVDKINDANKEQAIFVLDKNIVKHALIRICNMWNKDEKARKFLKHIIGAFLIDYDKVLNFSEDVLKDGKNVCAIMGYKLAGIYDIASNFSKLIIDRAKIGVAQSEEEKQEAINAYKEKLNEFPLEIRLRRFAYSNIDKSNKYLSNEAFVALTKIFVTEMIMHDDYEMVKYITFLRKKEFGIPTKKPFHKNYNYKKYNKSEENPQDIKTTNKLSDFASSETINKLESLN